jgi:hypothetical protein
MRFVCDKTTLRFIIHKWKKFVMKGKGWFIGMAITVALVYTGFVYLVPWY